jgi:hypothetical protein
MCAMPRRVCACALCHGMRWLPQDSTGGTSPRMAHASMSRVTAACMQGTKSGVRKGSFTRPQCNVRKGSFTRPQCNVRKGSFTRPQCNVRKGSFTRPQCNVRFQHVRRCARGPGAPPSEQHRNPEYNTNTNMQTSTRAVTLHPAATASATSVTVSSVHDGCAALTNCHAHVCARACVQR